MNTKPISIIPLTNVKILNNSTLLLVTAALLQHFTHHFPKYFSIYFCDWL